MTIFLISTIFHCGLLAISVSWTRSPFMSLMFAVMLFINASIVLLMLGFEFLALVNMLVYVGALAVLFLFVIMLLEIPSAELRAYHRGWSTLALFGILGCWRYASVAPITKTGALMDTFKSPIMSVAGFVPTLESINYVGHAFYIRYADVLIINSLVLTVALFGALVLANTK
uniref:NADH-ubiquinone oxidoreductase chain 6 n=1 Tax=Chlamydomonas moewusii TaxID=3054 RepID=O47540_CHLMO|nr:NADH dehydrogenase subunit 6 [Chlamydomonas moewusii]AAC39349.1 NADH dehydrogenase subunit 6 [Chlamydomonas moewusii]QRM91387.1 NADH dehydrogenase subunit 6 [Chlamydomonas moewusii]